ncbi:hypothetical protein GGX14DRAFT_383749 [Mycena pura]|uniref:Pectinesterase inhibitor domain-containing protein n=1 Tax=Mycena pura TaxID=153505 RepID=A0AAD6YUC2_9AGAR|nr:hypothetical protein GGX14DRAFT_383749 [Mycena pura]
MARIFVAFITFVSLLQSLAGCSKTFDVSVSTSIQAAHDSLGPINTASNGITNACLLLQAQLSLLDTNNAIMQIADSLLANAPPAPNDAQARIVAGLQAVQDQLSRTFLHGNITAGAVYNTCHTRYEYDTFVMSAYKRLGAVQVANTSIVSALVAAENDLKNCLHGDADAIDTGVDTPVTTTNTFSNEFSLSTEPE